MMRYFLLINLFAISLYSMLYAFENENIQLAEQAAAFFAARDYNKANEIYDQLLAKEMPEWERFRAIYNKGVIKLAQNRFKEAFSLFESIPVEKVTSMSFIEKLMMTQSMNYFQASLMSGLNDEERVLLFLDSSLFLTSATQMSCENQKAVELVDEKCLVPSEFEFLSRQITIDRAELLLKQLRAALQAEAGNSTLLLIQIGLDRLVDLMHAMHVEAIPLPLQEEYRSFIIHEAESLLPLWKTLQESKVDVREKDAVDAASKSYFSVLELIKKANWKESIAQLTILKTQLNDLSITLGFSHTDIKRLLIEYILILNKGFLEGQDLQKIQKQLQLVSNPTELIKKSIENLKISIQKIESGKEAAARLFVWASFYYLKDSTEEVIEDDPFQVLQKALEYAKRSRQLTLLAQLKKEMSGDEQVHALLVGMENKTLEVANNFIERVLIQQNEHFKGSEEKASARCQKYPWEQVIPLFENGYRSARLAQAQLSENPSRLSLALSDQYFTIKYWTQALDFLRRFSKNSNGQEDQSDSPQKDENMQEIFQALQKMESEDAPSNHPVLKERHTW